MSDACQTDAGDTHCWVEKMCVQSMWLYVRSHAEYKEIEKVGLQSMISHTHAKHHFQAHDSLENLDYRQTLVYFTDRRSLDFLVLGFWHHRLE